MGGDLLWKVSHAAARPKADYKAIRVGVGTFLSSIFNLSPSSFHFLPAYQTIFFFYQCKGTVILQILGLARWCLLCKTYLSQKSEIRPLK